MKINRILVAIVLLAFLSFSLPVAAQAPKEEEPQGMPQFLQDAKYRKALAGLFKGCSQLGFTWYWAKPKRKEAFYLPVLMGFDSQGNTKAAAVVLKPRKRGQLIVATGIVEETKNEFKFSGMHLVEQDAKGPLRNKNYRGQLFFKQFRGKEATEKLRLHGSVDAVSGATKSALGIVYALRDAVPWLKDCIESRELAAKALSNKIDLLQEYEPSQVIAEYDKPLPKPRRRRKLFGFLPLPF